MIRKYCLLRKMVTLMQERSPQTEIFVHHKKS